MNKQQQRAIDAACIARFRAEQQHRWGLSGGLLTLSLSRIQEQGEDDQPPPSSRRRRKKKRRSAGLQEKRGGAQA